MHRRRVGRRLFILRLVLLDLDREPLRAAGRVLDRSEDGDGALDAARPLEQTLGDLVAELLTHQLEPPVRVRHQLLGWPASVADERVRVLTEKRKQRVLGLLGVVEEARIGVGRRRRGGDRGRRRRRGGL